MLMSKFGHCQSTTLYRLFKTYCMSAYGSSLWNFDHSSVDRYFCAWRKCIRRIFRLSPMTHSNLLPGICNDLPPEMQLHSRFMNFIRSCMTTKNSLVKMVANHVIDGSRSAVSNSLSMICHLYGLDRYNLACPTHFQSSESPQSKAIRDYISLRDMSKSTDDRRNLQDIIDELCIN